MKNLKISEYITIKEASQILNEGYSTTHAKLDKFNTIKIGNQFLIEKNTLDTYIDWKNKYKENEA